jgi:hypothetical protein
MFMEKLAADPQRHGNISAASIYRLIEHDAPVLLLDEGDNLNLKFDRVMRSVLNDGSARLNNIDPKAWLADVLARIADIPQSRLHELLPWNWTPPASAASTQVRNHARQQSSFRYHHSCAEGPASARARSVISRFSAHRPMISATAITP